MRMRIFFLCVMIAWLNTLPAQITQVVRGKVVDRESKAPLVGVNVAVYPPEGEVLGSTTDENGAFVVEGVPVGRVRVVFSYLGYNTVVLDNITVTSAKEVVLNVEMEEAALKLEEVKVVAQKYGEVRNEMALISARQFSVSETERYAGSRADPARMVRNYAGVVAADDSRNDIVVRGNTPTGVLWRLEGINVPNPNHFAIPGTRGGSVTILNNKFLSNSDFFTGAFPAEYANAIAGVFDLRMRNGNNQQYEYSAQFGFLGTELMAEGPFQRGKSSFLAMYRYSTVALFHYLGIDIGTDATPQYQDGAFRLHFPLRNGGDVAVFGLGGWSSIDIIKSVPYDTTETELYGSNDRDQYFTSQMGVVGVSYSHPLGNSAYLKNVVALSHQRVTADHDKVVHRVEGSQFVPDTLFDILHYVFEENKLSWALSLNVKYSRRWSMKAGINADLYRVEYRDRVRAVFGGCAVDSVTPWRKRWDAREVLLLFQPYVQWKYKYNQRLTYTFGATSLAFTISPKAVSWFEPRAGLSYAIDLKSRLNIGVGLHSQILSPYLYFYDKNTEYAEELSPYNRDLDLMKSWHFVVGYMRILGQKMRMRIEGYYQYLYDLPVSKRPGPYALVNSGSGFSRFFPDTLVSTGIGRNIGVDFMLERGFHKGYFFIAAASLYDAKYRGSDGIWRNSAFNGRYALNIAGGREFKFGPHRSLTLSFRTVRAGGQRHGIVDTLASALEQDIIYRDERFNEFQFRDYFRFDLRVNYVINTSRLTHDIGIDLINLFDTPNALRYSYVPCRANPIVEERQLGRLPIFYYRLDF